jgi:hypothetical protein
LLVYVIKSMFEEGYNLSFLSIFNIGIFLWLSTFGFPKVTILDKQTGAIRYLTYSGMKVSRFEFSKHDIGEILVSDEDISRGKGNLGVIKLRKGGGFYVYNIFAFLLSPKKHHQALRQLKEELSKISS